MPSDTSLQQIDNPDHLIHMRAGGVSLLLDLTAGKLPAIIYWGRSLGEIDTVEAQAISTANIQPVVSNAIDVPERLAIIPEQFTGWAGRPGLSGSRNGKNWSPKFALESVNITGEATQVKAAERGALIITSAALVSVRARDVVANLTLTIDIEMLGSGLIRARAAILNSGKIYQLDELSLAFPLPQRAREILDFAGRWGLERVPQRRELTVGIHLREGRRGRTGADAATVLSVGTPAFGFAAGDVWGVHVGFSGNHRHYAERVSSGSQVIGGGELLLPGEIRLERGEQYTGPWVYAAYGAGLDDQARRFHRYLRARPQHPNSERPMTINVWEAVYFDHNLPRLLDLADRAAALGVERYVLDDGWFRGRRDDTAGLGDWFVDETVWPEGLSPLIDHVHRLGMQFGLWFEPEMINENSDLARAHPDWIMQTGGRIPVSARNQQVLNLGLPAAFDYILERICAILDEYDIAYIKWDHNRDLIDAGTAPGGAPGVHTQTLAVYRMMDELRRRYPRLEIESCSSGGGRVDLGILERTDRVWASDCIDPLERQRMNRWTGQLIPPELLGSHIASGKSHTTGRVHELAFRAATAFFGHFGIEWDLAAATAEETSQLARWISLYKSVRSVLHSGDVVRMDSPDESLWISGVVSQNRDQALFSLAYMSRSEVSPRGRFTLRGLDPGRRYRIQPVLLGLASQGLVAPAWFDASPKVDDPAAIYPGIVLTGKTIASVGLQAPASFPESTIILEVTAV